MTHTCSLNAKKGFTLVELLVAIAIIGILLGLLLPNLSAVQQTAKAQAQNAIIQGYGKGFMDFSTLDGQGRLSSGAYDHYRDGDFTKIGWVADLVNNKFGNPNKSLDPVGRMKINEKFADAAGVVTSGKFNDFRWVSTANYQPSDNGLVSAAADITGTGYFGSNQTVWDDGYNTNFATTWHFSRGDNIPTTADAFTINADSRDGDKSPLDGDGPLSTAHLADATMLTTADKVALLGASRTGDGSDSQINAAGATTNDGTKINLFIDPTGRKVIAKVGDFTVESFTDGPAASVNLTDLGTNGAGVYSAGGFVHEINDIVPNAKAKKIVNSANPNGITAGGYANIVFADGSSRRVSDDNGFGGKNKGDGWVGPYKADGKAGTSAKFTLDKGAYDEVRDDVYLGRLRARMTAGGGSSEN